MNSLQIILRLRSPIDILRLINQKTNTSVRTFNSLYNCVPLLSPNFPAIHAIQIRNFPKGKEKPKNKIKKVEIREDIINEHLNFNSIRTAMELAIENMKNQYIENVSLRSSMGSVESLTVEFEGETFKIQDLAQINRRNPKIIALNFSAFPQTIPAVLEVINTSGMNLTPQQDGTSLYIPIPKVTREHRENLAKNAKALFLKCKENIRNVQSKCMKQLDFKEMEGLSKERYFLLRDQLTALADQHIAIAEMMKDEKQKELLHENE